MSRVPAMRSRVPTVLGCVAAVLLALSLGGCVGNASGQLSLPREQAEASTYFVQRHAKDTRDLASGIADSMRTRGLKATAGIESDRPADAAFVVTYVDRWIWDMRMYLADLRIEVRDAKDQSIVGFGQSSQSSLKAMGQTHADIVETALDQLFPRR
jgi:hypothetical protein